jgi:hypothetical protein
MALICCPRMIDVSTRRWCMHGESVEGRGVIVVLWT